MASSIVTARGPLARTSPGPKSFRACRNLARAPRLRFFPSAAIDPTRDTIVVFGCKERTAQCAVDQLSKNTRSAGTTITVCLPHSSYVGVKNPFNAMASELLFADKVTIECLSDLDCVDAVDQSTTAYADVLAEATGVIIANEYAPDALAETVELLARIKAGKVPRLRRVVFLSHIGVERRTLDPYKTLNRKTKIGTGVIGRTPTDGGAPLDKWFTAENLLRVGAGDVPINDDGSYPAGVSAETVSRKDWTKNEWTYTVIRVGDLRGNGPTSVVFGDAMLTLVDNAFDVRMQDITMERGDRFDGFTKRLSVAVVMNRMLTSTQNRVLNKTFSCISTGPVDRERRKGWDVAKGRSPPPLEDKVVDEEIAPKEEESGETEGAAAPVPT